MQANDVLSIQMVTEVSGVQCVMGSFWKVNTYSGPDADATIINQLVLDFWETIKNAISNQVVLSCVKMVNLTTPAKEVLFPALAGVLIGDTHPPHQVIRLNQFGAASSFDPVWRNAINISGVAESLSNRGRLTDSSGLVGVEAFMSSLFDSGPNGATLDPQIRQQTAPNVYDYYDVDKAELNEKFMTLRSRKYRLCV